MSKIMTVDILSSIKGAKPSETVNKLFEVIKNANLSNNNNPLNNTNVNAVAIDDLRADEVVSADATEKAIIKANFPNEKDGFLVVSKVIED